MKKDQMKLWEYDMTNNCTVHLSLKQIGGTD
jgi:hypothetical protein